MVKDKLLYYFNDIGRIVISYKDKYIKPVLYPIIYKIAGDSINTLKRGNSANCYFQHFALYTTKLSNSAKQINLILFYLLIRSYGIN